MTQNMAKYSFHDDYSEGAHPNIIDALSRTNMSQQSAYGDDDYCNDARKAIRALIGSDEATVYFTPGGTSANILSIACHLRPHEAIIAADSGHIVGKEGGAIEAIGQKIVVAPGVNGKLTPDIIQSAFTLSAQFPYQPKARMVYVSNATEMGTVYTKRELESIASLCKKLGMFLLLDGARLGAALTSSKNDMSMADIYNFTDIFWIGGTKNGALLGEAVVIKDPSFGSSFGYHMKQRGALLAKGRVLGIQFATLFQDDLFFLLARHANDAAEIIGASLTAQGYKLWAAVDSNQVFVIFPAAIVRELAKSFDFVVWEHLQDEMQVVRLVTSWATLSSEVSRFCEAVAGYSSA